MSDIDEAYQRVMVSNVVARDVYAHRAEQDEVQQYRAIIVGLDQAYRALIETVLTLAQEVEQ